MEIIEFVKTNAKDLLLIVTSLVTIASVIVKLTPTQTDDNWLAKILPWLEKLALNKKA